MNEGPCKYTHWNRKGPFGKITVEHLPKTETNFFLLQFFGSKSIGMFLSIERIQATNNQNAHVNQSWSGKLMKLPF